MKPKIVVDKTEITALWDHMKYMINGTKRVIIVVESI